MILEVRHLRVIDAIVREGGVSRAAERLHLTQPAVSHALRDLEDRLGVKLFERGARRMQPTPECQRLLRAAGIVLDELRRAEDDVAAIRNGQQGVLRIATQCYTCYHWLPRVLSTMTRDFPKVELQIVPEATRRPIEALIEESLDLAITSEVAAGTQVVSERLFDDELVAIVAPGHRLADRPFLEAADFADEHVILHGARGRHPLSARAPARGCRAEAHVSAGADRGPRRGGEGGSGRERGGAVGRGVAARRRVARRRAGDRPWSRAKLVCSRPAPSARHAGDRGAGGAARA